MDWSQAKDEWTQLRGRIKEEWGSLTDDDLLRISGQREQLLAEIRKHYHVAVEEAERQVREWERKVDISRSAPE